MRPVNRILMSMAVCWLMPVGGLFLHAETIGQKEAKSMAQKFFNVSHNKVTPPVTYVYNGKNLTPDRIFTPFYVFNSPSGGFVIVSADNKAFPILAYSLKENFEKDNMNDMIKGILSGFCRDIEKVRYDSRIPVDAIEQWTHYPELLSEIQANPENDDFFALSLGEGDSFWMVRHKATEFDFKEKQPVQHTYEHSYNASSIVPEAPLVTSNNAGHFALSLSVEIERVIVYDIAGMMVDNFKYNNTSVAYVDIASHPNGFYVALAIDCNGVGHAVKLYR